MTRRVKRTNELHIGEAELVSMTNDLRDAHSDSLPQMRSSLDAWRDEPREGMEVVGLSRRSFLKRSGLLAAGGLLVSSTGAAAATRPHIQSERGLSRGFLPEASAPLDVRVAALAASLENLAIATYAVALSAATAGKLGTVPKAVATFVETAMAQHKDHAAAWNAIISSAGYEKISAPNAPIGKVIDTELAKVTDVAGVAMLALTLEDAAAATYLEAIGVVTGRAAIETAATIQPVEMQHAAILNFVLGKYPVPQPFATLTGAASLSEGPGVSKH
jgi:hypothetical protein